MLLLPDIPADADGNPILANWSCPVCGKYTPRVHRPGRPCVYCSNACRQKAYRYRRRHGIRLLRGDGQPTERAAGARVTHLMRPDRDPVSRPRRSDRRAVSLCGAFVRPARDHEHLRPHFPFNSAHACFSCLGLTGADDPDPPMIHPWQNFHRAYTGPPVDPYPAPPGYSASLRGRARRRSRGRLPPAG